MKPLFKRWKELEFDKFDKTPLGVSGLLLSLFRHYFTFATDQFAYSADPVQSKILIDLHQQWNPSNCENYPGIYIKRNEWVTFAEGRVLGDYAGLQLPDDGYSYEFWVPVTVSYDIICVGKEYGEIEKLLNEVYVFLISFSEPIRLYFKFARFDVKKISPIILYKEEKNYRVGTIDLLLSFDYSWRLTLEQPLLKGVNIKDTI